ncbi:MAG: hypothetical protein AMXMBFR81_05370 [Chthonomonas sp.]
MTPRTAPFDALCLAASLADAPKWLGARVQKVVQVAEDALAVNLYAGESLWLLVSWNPRFARLHPTWVRRERMDPKTLVEAMRARVEDGRLVGVEQMGRDRVVVLSFEGEHGPHRLVVEMMGKHSNAALLDAGDRIIACAKHVGRSQSRRPMLAGQPYVPPPVFDAEALPPLVKALIGAGDQLARRAFEGEFQPTMVPGFGPYPVPLDALGFIGRPVPSYPRAADSWFFELETSEGLEAERSALVGQLERVALAREVALHDLAQAEGNAMRAGQWTRQGELLLAYANSIPKGADRAEVWDYDGNPVTLSLDPELTPLEQAQKWFTKAKRAKEGRGELETQRQRLNEDLDALRAYLSHVRLAQDRATLQQLRAEAASRRWLQKASQSPVKEERPYQGHRVRELLGPGGAVVLYGENATANDYLTTRVARPNDWWLHVRGAVSAHVVVPTANHPERTPIEVLRFAAEVAVRHSVLKHSSVVPVDYTLKKHVRKPKGSAAGFATYTHEKTLHVN